MDYVAKLDLEKVKSKKKTPFSYLKIANGLLASPEGNANGREYVIRALNEIELFDETLILLKNLVRKSGLYPYLNKYFKNDDSSESDFLLSLYESDIGPDFIFHSMQARVYKLLMSGSNVILGAPTSMGKSAIVDSLIVSGKYKSLVIVVPTIALIDETRKRIQSRFGASYQIIYHGSQCKERDKVVYILTQERVNERVDLKNIDIFVIDEFYKLAFSSEDKGRVVALNIALSKLMSSSKQFYMIGPYIDFVRGLDCLNMEYVFIPTDFNTVALDVYKYNIGANDFDSKNKKLKNILFSNHGQTIIYCKSQNSISNVFNAIDYLGTPSLSDGVSAYCEWLNVNYGSDWVYSRAMALGVGIHHGALPRAIQQKTVELFNSKEIKYLICTSTLIEGVNTAAENVVIYDNRRASFSIDRFTQKNISGRAGRMNQYLVGNVFCLEGDTKGGDPSNVVDVALAQQEDYGSLNMLVGIQDEHLTVSGTERLSHFKESTVVPIDIVRDHVTYDIDLINSTYTFVERLDAPTLLSLISKKSPSAKKISILTDFIKVAELKSLRNLAIHFDDSEYLKNRMSWYIYSENHSEYMKERVNYIYDNYEGSMNRSDETDRELKVVRHIFKYAIPRALRLFQDLANFQLEQYKEDKKIDFGYLIHIFENSHLPGIFSAVEEMGIAIETLEKIKNEKLSDSKLDTVARYIRRYYMELNELDYVDRMFIELAVHN